MTSTTGRDNVEALVNEIAKKIPGFHVVIGGEDLQRARAALAGGRGLRLDSSLHGTGPTSTTYTSAATKAIQTAHALSAALERQKLREADESHQRALQRAAQEHTDAIDKQISNHALQLSLPRLRTKQLEFDLETRTPDSEAVPAGASVDADSTAAGFDSEGQGAHEGEGAGGDTPRGAAKEALDGKLKSAPATPVRTVNAVDAGFGTAERQPAAAAGAPPRTEQRRREPWWAKIVPTPRSDAPSFLSDGSIESGEIILALLQESEKDIRVKELALAAMKYAAVEAERPGDYDVEYNFGLVLQELATHVSNSGRRHSLLRDACAKYSAAARSAPHSYAAPYNWAVALGDMATLLQREDPDASRDCLRQASHRYAQSVELAPTNPQTLNNWGLVLQELGLQLPLEERRTVTRQAAAKFRTAIRNRPDYDRCCYNLGTVWYRFGMQLQQEHAQLTRELQQYVVEAAAQQAPEALAAHVAKAEAEIRVRKEESDRLVRYAATYVLLASLLQPLKTTYSQALGILRKLLPPNGVMTGKLLASHRTARSEVWRAATFLLTHDSLFSLPEPGGSQLSAKGGYMAGLAPGIANPLGAPEAPAASTADRLLVDVTDVSQVLPIMDPSMPDGHSFWLCLRSKPQGLYFVAEHQEDAEVWVDAITLVSHISHSRANVGTPL